MVFVISQTKIFYDEKISLDCHIKQKEINLKKKVKVCDIKHEVIKNINRCINIYFSKRKYERNRKFAIFLGEAKFFHLIIYFSIQE